jgi:hypothetical protein
VSCFRNPHAIIQDLQEERIIQFKAHQAVSRPSVVYDVRQRFLDDAIGSHFDSCR